MQAVPCPYRKPACTWKFRPCARRARSAPRPARWLRPFQKLAQGTAGHQQTISNRQQTGGHANKPRRIRRIYARNAGACQFPVDAASALPPHADACHHLPAGLHADAASAQNQHGGAQNPTQGHTQSHAPQGQRQAAQEFSGLRHAVSPARCGRLPARRG